MGIKSAVTAGIGLCFVIVAIEAFKRIFLHILFMGSLLVSDTDF